ncbi:response regulator [Herbivorax sp. ANBcel31]|uniref:response regulator n=1 Tax=Herbivorax sp. ANBcel31 TaxID=3069754 RepID=UPI0027B4D0FB|nr:response regulator [Herbivorax sp. ANBcel31]MDQ2086099.1 response regulator [Herbivorax sp. ANBcel31]
MDGTILIIDYYEYEREKIKITFDTIGEFDFIEVKNSNEFYNLKEIQSDISLIILDIEFPVAEEGFEILSSIKSKSATSDIPVIIVTKADNRNHRKASLKFNVRDYIIKPYRTQRLRNSIRSVLKIDQSFRYNIDSANVITLSIEDYITKEFKIASRANKSLSIILITPIHSDKKDTVTQVNSEFMSNVYNSVIERVKLSSRYTDTVILNENKDILVILPFTNASGSSKVVEKIKISISEGLKQLHADFNELFYTVYSTFPDDGKNFQELIKKAIKQIEDKIMLEKITSIGENALDEARNKYNKFKI